MNTKLFLWQGYNVVLSRYDVDFGDTTTYHSRGGENNNEKYGGFIKGILRGVIYTKSLRVLFLHRRPPSWTTLVLYSRAVFIFNEPAYKQLLVY